MACSWWSHFYVPRVLCSKVPLFPCSNSLRVLFYQFPGLHVFRVISRQFSRSPVPRLPCSLYSISTHSQDTLFPRFYIPHYLGSHISRLLCPQFPRNPVPMLQFSKGSILPVSRFTCFQGHKSAVLKIPGPQAPMFLVFYIYPFPGHLVPKVLYSSLLRVPYP